MKLRSKIFFTLSFLSLLDLIIVLVVCPPMFLSPSPIYSFILYTFPVLYLTFLLSIRQLKFFVNFSKATYICIHHPVYYYIYMYIAVQTLFYRVLHFCTSLLLSYFHYFFSMQYFYFFLFVFVFFFYWKGFPVTLFN